MLRHSPLPPLVLGSVLALGIALTGARTDAASPTQPMPDAPAVRIRVAPPPGQADASAVAIGARRPTPREDRRTP